MKYSLFLFFISMLLNQSAFAEWASNKTCAPIMRKCMEDYSRNYSNRYNTPAGKAAMAQCNVRYEECATNNGVIKQDNGSYAQMYHPANPDYIACKKTIDDANSDAFRRCMRNRNRQATQPKSETTIDGGRLEEVVVTAPSRACSKRFPRSCKTEPDCAANNGSWDGSKCIAAQCPEGTTQDSEHPEMCNCNNEVAGIKIEAGSQQQCPRSCTAAENKVYDPLARGCACAAGFVDRTGLGTCVSSAAPATQVAACIQELQDKITACNTASTAAVDRCDPKRQSGGGDGIDALQGLLQGAVVASGGAAENCGRAAVAGSTGYFAIEELRGKCDTEISACKTSCSDATAYINANKDRIYEKCRQKAWDDQLGMHNSPPHPSEREAFNSNWDGVNRAPFEQQIQDMQTKVTDYNSKCEADGIADSGRDKMTDFMDEMNTAFKGASQCECQLNPNGSNCANQVGPAECAVNPSLLGCATASINCLSAADNSPKCICFKNPNSNECKNIQQTNQQKINSSDVSSFAGVGSGFGGSASGVGDAAGKTESGDVNVGDLSGLGADGENVGANASGTATTDAGSPFGAAAGGGGSTSGGGAGGGANDATNGEADGEDESTGKKLGGLFNVAKSAFGNLFKKGKDDKGTYDPVTGKYINENGLDSKKWRPRGMVRGLAGDTEIAGKFDDIWKVMNRQYKIQDQKDTFLFGGEKK